MSADSKIGWSSIKLNDLTTFVIGGDWGKDVEDETNNDFFEVGCIRAAELKNWRIEKGKTAALRKIKGSSLESRELTSGDIILEISGGGPDQPVGRTVYIDEETIEQSPVPLVCTNFFRLLRMTDFVNIRYIQNYLHFHYLSGDIIKYQGGSNNLRNLRFSDYKEINIPLAPRQEQNRISQKIETIFMHIDSLNSRIDTIPQLLKQFRQQVLSYAVSGKLTEDWRKGKKLKNGLLEIQSNRQKYFDKIGKVGNSKKPNSTPFNKFELDENYKLPTSWNIANIKNIADLITDGEHATPKRSSEGYYLLSARNIQNGYISLDKVDFVPEDEYLRIKKRCNPEFNDVLISCSGSVGRVCTVPINLKFVMVRSAALIKLQSNQDSAKYIEFVLRSDLVQNQIKKLQKATAQANLFIEPIGKIVIPIPSIIEQKEIVRRVENLFFYADAIEEKYKTVLTSVEQLPHSILKKAFEGSLVKQNPKDEPAEKLVERIKKNNISNSSKKNKR